MRREQIDPRQLLVSIAKILSGLRIPYIVTGGIAVLIWGRPRFTADIDIVIELNSDDIPKLKNALLKLSRTGYIDEIAMKDAFIHEGEFNFVDGQTGVKVDFWILKKKDPFDRIRLARKISKKILGKSVHFTSPEDLILIKLLWSKNSQSTRQYEDVESIIKISGEKLDTKYMKQWAKKLGVSEILHKLI